MSARARTRVTLGTLTLAAATALSGVATAQNVQNFQPAVGTWNYLKVEGAQVGPAGHLVPSLYLNYGRKPLVRRDKDNKEIESLVDGLATLDVLAAYSFTDRLELGLALPISYVMGGAGLSNLPGASDGAALNDMRVVPKVRLLGGEGEAYGVALSVPVTLPTGDPKRLTGDDTVGVQPRLIAEARLGTLRAAANVGFKYRPSSARVGTLEVGNELSYGAGVGFALSEAWIVLGEASGTSAMETVKDQARPLEALVGARWFAPWCGVVSAGGGLGIVGDYGSPEYRALLGFAWQCRSQDTDGDGLDDPDDECPTEAEDRDGFEDADGCPDPDNDKDGVADPDDRCPTEAEDRDGFEDADGCPDPDNDKDGVADADDRCPTEAEDRDDFEDADGCPDPDNDKDGIADADDKCPIEAETPNGFEDDDGCPDEAPKVAEPEPEPVKVKVTEEKIEILERVYFKVSKARIQRRSYPLLRQVAAALLAHPEILKVRVEGHTDRTGVAYRNLSLSKARARTVRRFLIRQGVQAERLVTEGYGATKPLVSPRKRGAAAKNRRVEFVILEHAGAGPAAPTGDEVKEPGDR